MRLVRWRTLFCAAIACARCRGAPGPPEPPLPDRCNLQTGKHCKLSDGSLHPAAARAQERSVADRSSGGGAGNTLGTFVGNALGAGSASYERKAVVNPHGAGGSKPYDDVRKRHSSSSSSSSSLSLSLSSGLPQAPWNSSYASSEACAPRAPRGEPGEPSEEPEDEAECACAFDPAAPETYARLNLLTQQQAQQHQPGAYARAEGGRSLVFSAGGMALGNALLGFLTTYHDALRTGRALVLQRGGIVGGALGVAFDLGLPWASRALLDMVRACASVGVHCAYARMLV